MKYGDDVGLNDGKTAQRATRKEKHKENEGEAR